MRRARKGIAPLTASPTQPSSSLGFELEILDEKPGAFAFATWLNVALFVWTARADDEAAGRFERAIVKVSRLYPNGRSIVSIIGENLPLPSDRMRSACIDLLTKPSPGLACIAVVVQGDGFSASTLRSFHTGLRFESARSFEYGVFDQIDEVKTWLPERHLKKTGVQLAAAGLDGAARSLIARAMPRAGSR
jgi:hypothetical protein